MTAILILNWNGHKDTIECLKSLLKLNSNEYWIVVGDNGSTDNSLGEISSYLEKENIPYHSADINGENNFALGKKEIILLNLGENHGFSRGNNLMIEFINKYSPDNFLLLNNDTVVTADFLQNLVVFQRENPQYKVLTPLIYYFSEPEKIWNAGGRIRGGFNKYHYARCTISPKELPPYLPCTFITGCALFFVKEALDGNRLFIEKFFFGEEDFEFSLRMKRSGIKMACVTSSIIYHKVSSSSKGVTNLNKVFIHYLNRFINLRDYMNPIRYFFTIRLYNLEIYRFLRKTGHSRKETFALLKKLGKESRRLNGVSKEYFEEVWKK